MKNITFHINNEAYTVDIGEDPENKLQNSLKKFLTTEKNLSTAELLLAYLRKTQELLHFENEVNQEISKIPILEELKIISP